MSDDTTPSGRARLRTPDSAKIKIKGRWTAIPNRMLLDQRLSRDARILGCLLFMHAGNSGKAFPSQEELAAELSFTAQTPVTDANGKTVKDADGRPVTEEVRRDITIRSIQRWLNELREAGWLDWRQTMRNNEYILLDPDESGEHVAPDPSASSLRNTSPRAKKHVFATTAVSPSNTTEGSPGATAVSPSNTTEGSPGATLLSPSNTTEGSPGATAVSYSSSYRDSLMLDSSSEESFVDDGTSSHAVVVDSLTATLHTESSRYLAEKAISAALEFRDLPLYLVERTWHDVMGRDPGATPGAVVLALRAIAAARAAAPPPIPDADDLEDDAHVLPRANEATVMTPVIDEHAQRMNQLWQTAMSALQTQLPRPEIDTWLRNTTLLTMDNGIATISAVTAFQKEGLENRYLAPIRRALGAIIGAPIQARVVLGAPEHG
ncbi:hypothetical protein K2Z83_22850 [Oscillochloris sp. ZM17-4]|uniref:helix-turn-helix domain-containing protein n=1 Tax=Oscillochloris sp. ZM17-4 TaxID=2866714 RepID=UPI001C73128E|nr:helix-turn-helix domain-containing protein [Oscillochloris sp. ZM17-4]MBX0330498.1 hypothetical protein [Oscillochloris sp. ZM17-4]